MCITTARKGFVAYTLLLFLIAMCALGDLADRFASEARLDRDLVGVITTNIAGTEVKFLLVYINERAFQSGILKNPDLYEKLHQYVGKNALYVNPILEQVVTRFDFSPNQFAVEQVGKPGFVPTSDDWDEITPGFLTGTLRKNSDETSRGSGSEGILIMGDDIDPSQPFWVVYQGQRARFKIAPALTTSVPTAVPTPRDVVQVSPLAVVTELEDSLLQGDFSAEVVAGLLTVDQSLVGTVIVTYPKEELRFLFIRLEEGIQNGAFSTDLLTRIEPYIGAGALMVWVFSPTGAAFTIWNLYVTHGTTDFFLRDNVVDLTEGFWRLNYIAPGDLAAAILILPDRVNPAETFTMNYASGRTEFLPPDAP